VSDQVLLLNLLEGEGVVLKLGLWRRS
jgi:hypothetical protein